MKMERILSHRQAACFYDRLGSKLDSQAFYEDAVMGELAAHLDLGNCKSVVEYGCGTGRLAAELLNAYLPPHAAYLGVDISSVMVALAQRRTAPYGARAHIRLVPGNPRIDIEDESVDRFICTYVLDLLSQEDIRSVLGEAWRVLQPNGLLGLACLTAGHTPLARFISTLWRGLHRISPWLVGGCRPIVATDFIRGSAWLIDYRQFIQRFGICSEIVVARRLASATIR